MHDVIYGNIFLFNMLMNMHYINDMGYVHEYFVTLLEMEPYTDTFIWYPGLYLWLDGS